MIKSINKVHYKYDYHTYRRLKGVYVERRPKHILIPWGSKGLEWRTFNFSHHAHCCLKDVLLHHTILNNLTKGSSTWLEEQNTCFYDDNLLAPSPFLPKNIVAFLNYGGLIYAGYLPLTNMYFGIRIVGHGMIVDQYYASDDIRHERMLAIEEIVHQTHRRIMRKWS